MSNLDQHILDYFTKNPSQGAGDIPPLAGEEIPRQTLSRRLTALVDKGEFDDGSLDQVSGASYREIFDLADWDKSVGINVPGQSGQPGGKHYDDLLPLWSKGQYFPLNYSKTAVDAATTDVLQLMP